MSHLSVESSKPSRLGRQTVSSVWTGVCFVASNLKFRVREAESFYPRQLKSLLLLSFSFFFPGRRPSSDDSRPDKLSLLHSCCRPGSRSTSQIYLSLFCHPLGARWVEFSIQVAWQKVQKNHNIPFIPCVRLHTEKSHPSGPRQRCSRLLKFSLFLCTTRIRD